MGKHQIGDRVGAILCSDATTVSLLGYGVYEGDHTPPGTPPFEEVWEDYKKNTSPDELPDESTARAAYESFPLFKNPRIRLDNGTVVWGMQCWWGDEAKVRSSIEESGKTVVLVDIEGTPIVVN